MNVLDYSNKHALYIKIIILFVSLTYSWLMGYGFYGFGHDFYSVYYRENIYWYGWSDRLGWIVSTLTLGGYHIGVYLVSLMLALSSGYILRSYFRIKSISSILIYFVVYVLVIHTWPIVMSTSNVMRQGVAMSLVFLSLSALTDHKHKASIFLAFLSIFAHKSSILFFLLIIHVFFSAWITKRFASIGRKSILFSYGLTLALSSHFLIDVFKPLEGESRIIAGDYRMPFVLINVLFIIFSSTSRGFLHSHTNLFLYLFSFQSLSFLVAGYNWEYERLNMMMLIPYVLALSAKFDRKSQIIYQLTIFSVLFTLTVFTGMYSALT